MITPDRVRNLARELHPEAIRVRRHLHMYPELSFEERETARFVASELTSAGIDFREGIAGNGILATVSGDRGGPVLALRADMDALPITEENEGEYRSQNPGAMHACGHDGHTASLLTTARMLAALGDELPGTVKLIFQPAEERAPGGAHAMIEAGVLEEPSVDVVFGQHVNPELPAGMVGFNPGLFMASADDVYITVHGKGGHAAKPHRDVDPIVIASSLVVALQQIVSRNADPIVPSVLSFGRFIGDGAANVIPDTVELAGTFRTMDDGWRDEALARIERTARALVEALGGRADVSIVRGYPAVVNEPELTLRARDRAVEYLGDEQVVDLPPAMWGEDFSYYGRDRPACFYNLGVRNEQAGIVNAVHTPRFDLDEDALRTGSGLMAWITIAELEHRRG
ncbi:MAG: M20 metallopeptidase family protein [Spirochaetota bacterium]